MKHHNVIMLTVLYEILVLQIVISKKQHYPKVKRKSKPKPMLSQGREELRVLSKFLCPNI